MAVRVSGTDPGSELTSGDARSRWEPPLLRTAGLELLRNPVWVMDPVTLGNLYANAAALEMWNASSLEELGRRDFSTTSPVARARVDEVVRRTASGEAVSDTWTFYPPDAPPRTVDTLSCQVRLPDGRIAILKQGIGSRTTLNGKRLSAALHYTTEAISLYDAETGTILFRNAAAILQDPAGQPVADRFVIPKEGAEFWARARSGPGAAGVFRMHTAESDAAWHHVSARSLLDPATGLPAVLINERDISDLKRIEEDLREREAQLRESQNIAHMGDWQFDVSTRTFHASEPLQKIMGFPGNGISADAFRDRLDPDGREEIWAQFETSVASGTAHELFFRFRKESGAYLQCWASWQPRRDAAGRVVSIHGVTRDITDEYVARQRIHFLALHDAVTGLANRIHFTERLIDAVEGRSAVACGGLIVTDIVHFKDINDSYGHGTGDLVLQTIARRLHDWAGTGALVARIGGDEFGILLPGVGDPEALEAQAETMLERLREPIAVEGRRIRLAARVGLSLWPEGGRTADALQRNADLALYSLKQASGSAIARFTPALRTEADESRALLADLREALAENAIVPFFQPIVRLATGRVAGFEALARWTHPTRGAISPARFIPIAESGGLIWDLGDRMLTAALAQMSAWLADGLEPGRVAVNMGSGQVNGPEIVAHVARRLAEARLPAFRLELEVTETVTLGHQADAVMAALKSLSQQGISVVLYDFGTGHASLTHLHGLPVDRIKIDRSFVQGIGVRQSSEVIIRAVIGLAHSLSLEVVAEGVETPAQASFLAACGCDCVQGYLYGYPMPADEATRWLRRHGETSVLTRLPTT